MCAKKVSNVDSRIFQSWWLWTGVLVLLLIFSIGLFVILRNSASDKAPVQYVDVSPPTQPDLTALVIAGNDLKRVSEPTLPYLRYPPGSVEAACGFNNLPPYHYEEEDGSFPANSPYNAEGEWEVFESDDCQSALEDHINGINPYLWLAPLGYPAFSFIRLEEPLTFERIFADPSGDLSRVQSALANPECSLSFAQSNWDLKETCHAEAF